jgi:hypothetical protein
MNITKPLLYAVLLSATSTSAFADEVLLNLSCHFTTECLSGETCEETAYDVTLNLIEAAQSPLVKIVRGSFTNVAETYDTLSGFYRDGDLSVNGGGVFPASHHFTVGADGTAIYTAHLNSEMAATYLGRCT